MKDKNGTGLYEREGKKELERAKQARDAGDKENAVRDYKNMYEDMDKLAQISR